MGQPCCPNVRRDARHAQIVVRLVAARMRRESERARKRESERRRSGAGTWTTVGRIGPAQRIAWAIAEEAITGGSRYQESGDKGNEPRVGCHGPGGLLLWATRRSGMEVAVNSARRQGAGSTTSVDGSQREIATRHMDVGHSSSTTHFQSLRGHHSHRPPVAPPTVRAGQDRHASAPLTCCPLRAHACTHARTRPLFLSPTHPWRGAARNGRERVRRRTGGPGPRPLARPPGCPRGNGTNRGVPATCGACLTGPSRLASAAVSACLTALHRARPFIASDPLTLSVCPCPAQPCLSGRTPCRQTDHRSRQSTWTTEEGGGGGGGGGTGGRVDRAAGSDRVQSVQPAGMRKGGERGTSKRVYRRAYVCRRALGGRPWLGAKDGIGSLAAFDGGSE